MMLGYKKMLSELFHTFPFKIKLMLPGRISGVGPKENHCHLVVNLNYYTQTNAAPFTFAGKSV